jgi:hypothetical protein
MSHIRRIIPAKESPCMADTHNVFISWSGERSRVAAEALREWLRNVLQNAKPWMSTEIEKGSRSYEEIARALEGMKVGIICLTPENLTSEWLHYEAGALSKTLDDKTRVCTYLLADLDHATVEPPLSWFQGTKANKSDTRRLVATINNHLDATPLPETTLNATFEKWWPDLEKILNALPAPCGAPPPRRDTGEMIAELLELTRNMAPAIAETKEGVQVIENQLFVSSDPYIFQTPISSVVTNATAFRLPSSRMGRLSELAGKLPSKDSPKEKKK